MSLKNEIQNNECHKLTHRIIILTTHVAQFVMTLLAVPAVVGSSPVGGIHLCDEHQSQTTLPSKRRLLSLKMVYTRPSSLPIPTIWHRFTTRGTKLRVQDMTEDQVEPAVQLLAKYFMADEPPCKYIEIHKYPSAQAELEKLWRDTIKDKLSIVCVEDTDRPTDIIGVNILTVASKHDKEEIFKSEDKIWAKLFGAVDLVSRSVDVYSRFDVEQYLTAYGLVVDPKWRGRGIGKEILLARPKHIFTSLIEPAISDINTEPHGLNNKISINSPMRFHCGGNEGDPS
ncbi:unnamed protein product, partial [Brenthis ino]